MIEINIFILFFNNNLIKMSLFKNQFFQTNKICDICNQQSFPNNIEYEQIFPSKIIFKCVNSHEKIFSFQSLFKNNKNNNMQINKNINKNNNNISVKFRLEKILNRSEKYIEQLNSYVTQFISNMNYQINKIKMDFDNFKKINLIEIDFCRNLINNEVFENIKNFLKFNEQNNFVEKIKNEFYKINKLLQEFSMIFKNNNNLLLKQEKKLEIKIEKSPKSIKYLQYKEINLNFDIESLLILKNNKMIVSSGDGIIRIFKNLKINQIINESNQRIRYIIQLKNGNIAYCKSNGQIKIGKFDDNDNLKIIEILNDSNMDIVKIIENKNDKIISCSSHIIVWNKLKKLNKYQSEITLTISKSKIESILELPENRLVFSSSMLYILDMNTYDILSCLNCKCNSFSDTLSLIDKNCLVVAEKSRIQFINLKNYTISFHFDFHLIEIGVIKYHLGVLYVGYRNLITLMGKVEVYQINNNLIKIANTCNIHDNIILIIDFNEQNEMITGSFDNTIQFSKLEF